MKFREHRGGLDDSLATTVMLADKAALIAHVTHLLEAYPGAPPVTESTFHVKHLIYDQRCDWDTFICTLDDYGVVGFTDGPG
jgi:hypothetical protein